MERLAGLAVDKHLEVRRTAEQALARVHSLVDSSVLREHLDAVDLASDIRTTLLQILQVLFHPLKPSITDVAPWSFVLNTAGCLLRSGRQCE